ncbi:MAG TPA: hypothetical protein PLZ44_01630 [Methanothrix sp.]|nr:hypothetical protein [Methanothrix sp.]
MQIKQYICSDERRKLQIARHNKLKGIDYLEVSSDQSKLHLYFIPSLVKEKEPIPEGIGILNIRISGGSKITGIRVKKVEPDPSIDNKLTISVCNDVSGSSENASGSGVGDFSIYTLNLVDLKDADPIFSQIDFSFKINCPNDLDCREKDVVCLEEPEQQPRLDYLARDYSGFRRLILDRLSEVMPDWKEHSPADLEVVIAEVMAYAADYLAYYQDAVATEAYLGTARKRISMRRHARLIDYFLSEGCNARVWMAVKADPSADGMQFPGTLGAYAFNWQDILNKDYDELKIFLTKECGINWTDKVTIETSDASKSIKISYGGDFAFLKFDDENSEASLSLCGGQTIRLIADNAKVQTEFFCQQRTSFLTTVEKFSHKTILSEDEFNEAISLGAEVFEPINSITLHSSQNEMLFYTWGEENCCLPKNATRATLVVGKENPSVGDVLIFEESPKETDELSANESGQVSSQDLGYIEKRHAVRLINVYDKVENENVEDDLFDYRKFYKSKRQYAQFSEEDIHLIDIEWSLEDALPFPLCISKDSDLQSLAHGNVLLADHGRTKQENLAGPEKNKLYRPALSSRPLTQRMDSHPEKLFAQQADGESISASEILSNTGDYEHPAIKLYDPLTNREWLPERDLLNSGRFDRTFVAEIDDEGYAVLRFGDGINGMKPFSCLLATYRIGNGTAGNVGSDSIGHIYASSGNLPKIQGIRNPIHATGGKDPEDIDHARLFAPQALHEKEYAVTEDDYADKACRYADVQMAVATLRWTGSWHTMFINVERRGGKAVDAQFKEGAHSFLSRFCMAGLDMQVEGPLYVPLDIALSVVVKQDYFAADVMDGLKEEFSCGLLSDGRPGFFFPDEFTFGKSVYLSRVIARAIAVPGVLRVEAVRFQRMGKEAKGELEAGVIEMDRLEIARLDGDLSCPENGIIEFYMEGGR